MAQYVDGGLMQEILNRFEFMSYFYDPDALGRDTILQFHITHELLPRGRVSLYLSIEGSQCEIFEGISSRWDTENTVAYEYWLNIMARRVRPARIFADMIWSKNLRVRGNPLLFFKLGSIFGGTLKEEHLRPAGAAATTSLPQVEASTWHVPKHVVILSGSGRSKRRATSYHFSKLFAEGISQVEPKPTVEIVHLRDLTFDPCKGCFACWQTDGICVLKDDYQRIIEPMLETCDLLVLAFPLYFYDFPPNIRKVITRFFSRGHPFLRWHEGTQALVHYNRRALDCSIFLLGVSALPDAEQFEIPLKQMELLTRQTEARFIGALFRSLSNSFLISAARSPLLDDIEAAFVKAGRELASKGEIDGETRLIAEQLFRTPAELRAGVYAYYHSLNKGFKFPVASLRGEVSRFDVTSHAEGSEDPDEESPASTPDAA